MTLTENDNKHTKLDRIREKDKRETDEPILKEVKAAIQKLKNNKVPGIDNIREELVKDDGETLTEFIHSIMKVVWRQREYHRNRTWDS